MKKENGKPMMMMVKHGHGEHWKYWFVKCMSCWRVGKQHFGDDSICLFPYNLSVNHPALLCLGMCGCVICNDCIVNAKDIQEEEVTPWPYCGRGNSLYQEIKIWPISKLHSLTVDLKKVSIGGQKEGKNKKKGKK
jgi:hypothetical protein